MRILVTGGAGFVGSKVVEALRAAGHDCVVPGLEGPRVDFSDPLATNSWVVGNPADALVHCAWYGGDDRITGAENEAWIGRTERLLNSFVEAGGGRVVTVGSCLEYEFGADRLVEGVTPVRPHTPYGRAKAQVGEMVSRLTAEGRIVGTHARVGYLYGPGERPPRVVPALVQSLKAGKRFAATSGMQRRDYLYVADVGTAIATILGSEMTEPVNVGSGSATRVADLITAFARELDAEDLLDLGALPTRPGDPEVVELSIDRIMGLGWRPEVDLAEGVRRTVRSMTRPSSDEAVTR